MGLLNQTPQEYYQGNDFGNYQFTSLDDIINQFMIVYVGEDKIISKIKRTDVAFHAQRAIQELSFDTFKSCKAQEIVVPASLQMTLPQDYVNYTKISWVDSAGIKHLLYPTSKTSNPSSDPLQDADGDFTLQAVGTTTNGSATVDLDAEYKNILVGMKVEGAYIPADTYVCFVRHTGVFTRIKLSSGGAQVGATLYLVTESNTNNLVTFTFSNPDGSLILPKNSLYIDYDSFETFGYKITFAAQSDIADVKIGMLVNGGEYPIGTVVTHVGSNAKVVVSNLPLFGENTFFTSGGLTFISPDLKDSDTWSNYKSGTPSENQDDYEDDTYWPMDGSRFGLDPQHAQANGSFYIDCMSGKIHFSSNIAGKTVILDYLSDGLAGTVTTLAPENIRGEGENGREGKPSIKTTGTTISEYIPVHKFAEEAMYKWISHAVLASRANTPEHLVNRYKKERFAAIRTAKLRLSNIKLEEITQILRGKSKQLKH